MASAPAEYKWSSYSAFIGNTKTPPFLEINWLLFNFGESEKEAKRNYKGIVESVDIKTLENPYRMVTEGFIPGDSDKDSGRFNLINFHPLGEPESRAGAVQYRAGPEKQRVISLEAGTVELG